LPLASAFVEFLKLEIVDHVRSKICPDFSMHNHSTKNFGNTGENIAASTGADVQSLDRIAACSVCDWIGQINKAWTRGAAGTLELAKVVCAARSQLMYGQWTQLWKSADMPISKRTGEMLV